MHFSVIALVCALSVSCHAKFDVGGPHGIHNRVAKRESLQAVDSVHRRHHVKRSSSSSSKCNSGSQKQAPFNSGNSTNTPATANPPKVKTGKKGSSSSGSSSGDTSSSGGSSSSGSSSGSSSNSSASTANMNGVTGFQGTNSGIGSWFRTDNPQDDTNGRSWCQLNYQDSWFGFAPSVQTMLDNFGGDTTKAGTAYCGLEAKATNPSNGNTALIYIVDGFATQWVRTPGSIDLTIAAFTKLYGSSTTDKDIVIQNLQWEFTGNRNSQYAFNAGS